MSNNRSRGQSQARQNEAIGKQLHIEHRGLSYTVPPQDSWPVEAVLAIEDGKPTNALRHAMGEKQWAKFMSTHPATRDVKALYDKLGTAGGLDPVGGS